MSLVFGRLCAAGPAQVGRRCGRSLAPALACHIVNMQSTTWQSGAVQVWAGGPGSGERGCLRGVEIRKGGVWQGGRVALEAAHEGQQGLPL